METVIYKTRNKLSSVFFILNNFWTWVQKFKKGHCICV